MSIRALVFAGLLLFSVPQAAFAIAGAAGGGPHPICIAWKIQYDQAIQKGQPPPPPPPCSEPSPQGAVPGICQLSTLCKATAAPGGNLDQGMKGLGDMLKGLMDALKPKEKGQQQQQGGQGQQGGLGNNPYAGLYPPCEKNPITNEITNAPCTDTNGALVTGSGNSDYLSGLYEESNSLSDSLLDALYGDGGGDSGGTSNVSDDLLDSEGTETGSGGGETSGGEGNATSSTGVTATSSSTLSPQTRGDIVTGERGATVVGGSRNEAENVEVSGFIGAGSGNLAQSKSLVGRLCESRPWATGFLANIITPSFFDGLCTWRGYHVGPLAEALKGVPAATKTVKIVSRKDDETNKPPVYTGEPEVDVWATPDTVPLGTRTSVFWVSENVVACTVKGPSFEQNGISGGAATVPIAVDSTFTAVCTDAEGNELTRDSVTVRLSI